MFLSLSTCLFREKKKKKTTHQTVTFCFFVTCFLMGTFSGSFVILLKCKGQIETRSQILFGGCPLYQKLLKIKISIWKGNFVFMQ